MDWIQIFHSLLSAYMQGRSAIGHVRTVIKLLNLTIDDGYLDEVSVPGP